MAKYKVWVRNFGNWAYILRSLGIVDPAEREVVHGLPRFRWRTLGLELTTYSNPITGEHEEGVLPPGFGHVSYVGVSGDEPWVDNALEAIRKYAEPILAK